MKSELMQEIKQLRSKGYSVNDTARLTGTSPDQVRYAMRAQSPGNRQPDGTEVIDGEPIGDRIERLKREIRAGVVNVERQR